MNEIVTNLLGKLVTRYRRSDGPGYAKYADGSGIVRAVYPGERGNELCMLVEIVHPDYPDDPAGDLTIWAFYDGTYSTTRHPFGIAEKVARPAPPDLLTLARTVAKQLDAAVVIGDLQLEMLVSSAATIIERLLKHVSPEAS